MTLQQHKLEVIKSGKLVSDCSVWLESSSFLLSQVEEGLDVSGNLRLLPEFNECDPESLFFERVAEVRKWPDTTCTLMSQCALTGRARELYSALSLTDSQSYELVESTESL